MPLLSNLIAKLTLDSDQYEKGMKGAANAAKQFGKDSGGAQQGASKFSQGLGAVANIAGKLAIGGALLSAGKQAVDFAKQSIDAASTAEQGYGKFQAVFKDSADSVEAELGEMADEIKRSKIDLMGYASTLQDTFVPLGFAREEAAKMSVEIVGLAEDLASFNDIPTADVVRDLQSALVGNTETLRKYGVVANETAIKAKAMEMGIWDGNGAIDAQTKALAIYQITLDGTADAQGTAAREADTYDSATRGMAASMLDLKVAIGNELLPTMTDGTNVLGDLAGGVATAISFSQELTKAVEAGIITQEEANDVYFKAIDADYSLADAKEWLTGKTEANKKELEKLSAAAVSADKIFNNYTRQIEDTEKATDDLKKSEEELKAELNDLELFIKGPLGKEQKDWAERDKELTEKAYDLEKSIQALQDEEHLTEAQKEQLDTWQSELEDVTGKIEENEQAHKDATESILFDLLTQRAAVDGLSEAEMEFLNDVALEWGLVDQATHDAVKSIDNAMDELAKGNIQNAQDEIEELRQKAVNASGTYNIYFKVTSSGSVPVDYKPKDVTKHAAGGPVAMGNVSIVGEEGPELFVPDTSGMVIPHDISMAYIQGIQVGSVNNSGAGMGGDLRIYDGIHLHGVQDVSGMLAELSGLLG